MKEYEKLFTNKKGLVYEYIEYRCTDNAKIFR